ncbi:hypothetical protein Tco_0594441, partial [Tanacetum coccineum]
NALGISYSAATYFGGVTTCLAASSSATSDKLIDFPNSKAMSGSRMMFVIYRN